MVRVVCLLLLLATPLEALQDRPEFVRPDSIRGIYLNAWVAGSRSGEMIDLARRTRINTFVIDVKDATGYVSHRTALPLAREIGADRQLRIRDLPDLLRRLEAEGIYPIARIVVLKDPLLAAARPDLAIQDSLGRTWIDGRGDRWVNPWSESVHAYNIELAREVIELGFPEIQWDYIRFPDRPASELREARYPGAEGRPRSEAIRAFLLRSRETLDVPVTADVFGMTTVARGDVGIGQEWERLVDVVDALLPMVYPSHYAPGSYGFQKPNAHPYEIVFRAVRDGIRRTEAAGETTEIIPWLQGFSLGEPPYGPDEIRAQIRAVHDLGLPHWLLWNASARYSEEALR
jgi:hypothetical protein